MIRQIREGGDKGLPVSLAGPESKLARAFYEVAKKVAEEAKEIAAKSEDVLEISRLGVEVPGTAGVDGDKQASACRYRGIGA